MRKENLEVSDTMRLLDELKQQGVSELNRLDVADAEKRLARILKSAEGKEAFRRVTGLREAVFAGDVKKSDQQLPIVAVLMPSYRLPAPQAWEGVNRMIRSSMNVCQPFMEPTIRQSVVHWTRNYALSLLLKSMKPWDYVLFIDDDIVMPEDGLAKMLAHKVDLVAAACTVRVDPPMPNFRDYDPKTRTFCTCLDWNREGLVGGKNFGIGTGAALISRNCLERVAEYYINCKYEQKFYGFSGEELDRVQSARQARAKETSDFWWFEFLKQPDGLGEFGEDISFCFKCIELGIPVYVDTTIRPKHMGDYGYNLDDYCDLRRDYDGRLRAKGGVSLTEEKPKKILIGVLSYHGADEEEKAIRETWGKDVPDGVDLRFFVGGEDAKHSDQIVLKCGDKLIDLSSKVVAMCSWALEQGYTHLFKCDSDTLVRPVELVTDGFPQHDYVGGENNGFASGGSGYWLTRKAMEIVANAPITETHAEDVNTAKALAAKGIGGHFDSRYLWAPGAVADDNTVAMHLSSIRDLDAKSKPEDMYEAYRDLKAGNYHSYVPVLREQKPWMR